MTGRWTEGWIDWPVGLHVSVPAHHLLRLEREERQDVGLALAAEAADGANHGDGGLFLLALARTAPRDRLLNLKRIDSISKSLMQIWKIPSKIKSLAGVSSIKPCLPGFPGGT